VDKALFTTEKLIAAQPQQKKSLDQQCLTAKNALLVQLKSGKLILWDWF